MRHEPHVQPYEAYHLHVVEPENEHDLQYIAIMKTADEAVETLKALRRRPGSIEIVAQGEGVMRAAKRRGLVEGDVCALRSGNKKAGRPTAS